MTGFTYLGPSKTISNKALHDMFMELMLPEYKTREEVLTQARRNVTQEINNSGTSLEEFTEHTEYTADELREQLGGRKSFNFHRFNELHLMLGKNFDESFPYDPKVPASKYQAMHEHLFGRRPDPEPDPTGRVFVKLHLQEKFFED